MHDSKTGCWPVHVADEIGVFEKQTCFYMQAKTTSVTLRGNIAYNAPRALINFK